MATYWTYLIKGHKLVKLAVIFAATEQEAEHILRDYCRENGLSFGEFLPPSPTHAKTA